MKHSVNDVYPEQGSRRAEHKVPVGGGLTLPNLGRARETTEGYVHYLDRLAAEDATRDPIKKFLNFLTRHLPWRR